MNESTGKLILRVTLGFLILLHGISKLMNGVDWLDGMLADAGLPAFLKYGVYVGEVLAPLARHRRLSTRASAPGSSQSTCCSRSGSCTAATCSRSTRSAADSRSRRSTCSCSRPSQLALIGPGRYAFNQK